METYVLIIGFAMSILSTLVTVYFWLVRVNRERANLKTIAVAPATTAVDLGDRRNFRAKHLRAFTQPDESMREKSRAGVNHYYFRLKTLIINASALPSTITGVQARVKLKEGSWLALNTAYQLAEEVKGGPLAFELEDAYQMLAPEPPLEPRPLVIPGERSMGLRLLAWLYVPLGDRQFEWDRVTDEAQLASARRYVETLLAHPLEMEVELQTLSGQNFRNAVNVASGTLPAVVSLPGVPMPPLKPVELRVKPTDRPAIIMAIRKQLADTSLPDGSFRTEFAETTDLEATAFAVLAHRTAGWPLPAEDATRRWLSARQQADGCFLHGDGHLDKALPGARIHATHQALMALHALGTEASRDPLPALADAVRRMAALPADEGGGLKPSVAHAVAHAHLLRGQTLAPDLDKLLRPLCEPVPVFDKENVKTWEVEETNFHPLRFCRLMRRPVSQLEARLLHILRTVGRRGSVDHDSWRYQSDGRRYNFAIFAAMYSAHQLAPQSPVVRRLMDEAVAYIFQRSEGRDDVIYGGDVHRQLYATLAAFVLAGELKPERPLNCDPNLFGLGEHQPV